MFCRYPACTNPASLYSSKLAFAGKIGNTGIPQVINGNWQLIEDRKGKAGWIGTTPGTIRFPIELGCFPTIAISYLKSYEGLQPARLQITPDIQELEAASATGNSRIRGLAHKLKTENYLLIDPIVDEKHAQTTVMFLSKTDPFMETLWAFQEAFLLMLTPEQKKIQRNRRFKWLLSFTLEDSDKKFKLVNIVSC